MDLPATGEKAAAFGTHLRPRMMCRVGREPRGLGKRTGPNEPIDYERPNAGDAGQWVRGLRCMVAGKVVVWVRCGDGGESVG